METVLLLAALAYALASGLNDGGMLVGLATRTGTVASAVAAGIMVVAVIGGPYVLGTSVATTLSRGLAQGQRSGKGGTLVLIAVLVTFLVVSSLSRSGLPTSLTLALVGGIVGGGLGLGLPVGWMVVVRVLALALLAPLAAGLLAWLLAWWLGHARIGWLGGRMGAVSEFIALGAQAAAYSATGAQGMVAILAATSAVGSRQVPVSWWGQLLVGVTFGVGLLLGVPRTARLVSERFVHVRRHSALVAESSSAVVCLVAARLGAPVSLTQVTTGALLGGELCLASHHVRWGEARQIGIAWLLTLPVALLVAWAMAAVVTTVGSGRW
ncbi:MAG: inorganic phosphate transporter [Candidatus Dormibacteria bacterium]